MQTAQQSRCRQGATGWLAEGMPDGMECERQAQCACGGDIPSSQRLPQSCLGSLTNQHGHLHVHTHVKEAAPSTLTHTENQVCSEHCGMLVLKAAGAETRWEASELKFLRSLQRSSGAYGSAGKMSSAGYLSAGRQVRQGVPDHSETAQHASHISRDRKPSTRAWRSVAGDTVP